jgi:hypothetical protein
MADWSKSMQQTFEYYTVDPGTWKDVKKIDNIKSCSINWDLDTDTLGSATIDITDTISECYIRVYLVTIQNGLREKHPLGTFLVQTPSSSFDGKVHAASMDAYTPLIELKEKNPPLGYSILKNANIMDMAYQLTNENLRAPVVPTKSNDILYYDFVAETDDTWVTFIRDLLANAKYSLSLDELGRVLFAPDQDIASLQPFVTFDDSNSSILYPEINMNHDLYGLPNVVEVIYSKDSDNYYAKAVNDDENSPISTINRGREIRYRETNPSFPGNPTQEQVDEYAKTLLKQMSSIEYTISYTHGYCGVRLGDCVRLNYQRAGITNVKAKVISQTIKCEPGCPVSEKAVFTTKLWG